MAFIFPSFPFDMGNIALTTKPKSDFILPDSRNVSEYLSYSESKPLFSGIGIKTPEVRERVRDLNLIFFLQK